VQIFHVALVYHLSAQSSGFRTDVDDVVGRADDFLVMFHYYHRVAQLLQLAQHLDEAGGVAAV